MAWTLKAEHQGWTNYETWNAALWLDNERSTYEAIRERAREILKAGGERDPKFDLADWIKDFIEENKPDLGASMYSDILTGAISEINFDEIAGNIIEEIGEEVTEEAK